MIGVILGPELLVAGVALGGATLAILWLGGLIASLSHRTIEILVLLRFALGGLTLRLGRFGLASLRLDGLDDLVPNNLELAVVVAFARLRIGLDEDPRLRLLVADLRIEWERLARQNDLDAVASERFLALGLVLLLVFGCLKLLHLGRQDSLDEGSLLM